MDVTPTEDSKFLAKNLLMPVSNGAALLFSFQPFEVSEKEAYTITDPASRIIARNTGLSENISRFADPLALIIAACTVVVPRVLMYKMALAMQRQSNTVGVGSSAPPPQPPPTMANGEVHADFSTAQQPFDFNTMKATLQNE